MSVKDAHYDFRFETDKPLTEAFKLRLRRHIERFADKEGIRLSSFEGPPYVAKLNRLTGSTYQLLRAMKDLEHPIQICDLVNLKTVSHSTEASLRVCLMRLRRKGMADYMRGKEGTDQRLRFWYLTQDGKDYTK